MHSSFALGVSHQPLSFLARRIRRCLLAVAGLTLLLQSEMLTAPTALAEPPAEVLPGDPRVDGVKSPAEFFGFEIGSRHLRHDQVVAYFRYLADTSDRVELKEYGKSHGQRPLLTLMISSPENVASIEALQKKRRRLTSGSFQGDLANELLVMYMGYSVHGDEASGMNAAPLVAFHLASSESEQVNKWLDESLFIIDPSLNPDGGDRFANWVNENRGRYASPSAVDREHKQPWPGGRTNYYWFDLNRDWLPVVHPESQGRVRMFHQWKPNVVLDYHEMSGNSSYFFQPGIPARNNPFTSPTNLELTRRFAAEHAKSMDEATELYFTEERYDDFYIGKGSTYPDLHGAVGILFEQGSTRGLKLKNARTDRHFADTVANQVRTSLSSLRAAEANRTELLRFQREFYSNAIKSAEQSSIKAYILSGSQSRIDAAAQMMRAHDIRVYQPLTSVQIGGREIQPRSVLVVPTAQPEYTVVRSLMEPLQTFRENIFYDVSTWHLPSAFDLAYEAWESDIPGEWTANRWEQTRNSPSEQSSVPAEENLLNSAAVAFSPLELNAPKLVAKLQTAGALLRVSTDEIQIAGDNKRMPRGTIVMLKQPNAMNWTRLINLLSTASQSLSIETHRIASGLTPEGPDLGSSTLVEIPKCNPLLVVGEGTSGYGAGALWHFLDVRMNQPTTLINAEDLSSTSLHDYTCILLPEGSYSSLDSRDVAAIDAYVRDGGTVIAIASAIQWLMNQDLLEQAAAAEPVSFKHIDMERERADSERSGKQLSDAKNSDELQYSFATASNRNALESIAGAVLMTQIDPTNPLAFGFPDSNVPVFRDHELRFPAPASPYQLVARYKNVEAGFVNSRNRLRLQETAAVWAQPSGRGHFIMLADNPVFRGYIRSSERFLTNAMLFGPSLNIPAPPPEVKVRGVQQDSVDDEESHSH